MNFAAALLEYLVSGFIALIWFVPLARQLFGDVVPAMDGTFPWYLPAAYVLGIYIDATASRLWEPFRTLDTSVLEYDRTTRILAAASPPLVKMLEVYAGRDRIARGVLLNCIIAIPVSLFVFPEELRVAGSLTSLVGAVCSFFVWKRLDRQTSGFKEQALQQLARTPDTGVAV